MGGSLTVRHAQLSHGLIALAIAVTALAIVVSSASAASTRAEYGAQVDQTCAAFKPQLQRTGNAALKQSTKLASLATKLIGGNGPPSKAILRKLNRLAKRANRITQSFNRLFAGMVDGIAAVAAPPGDEAAVAQWINGLRDYSELNMRGLRAAKHGKFLKSLSLLGQALDALDTGGSAVQGFGISVCPTTSESPLF